MSHLQVALRQLVNTNVILKEHLDKQTEDKKAARKKLMQLEKVQSDKDKFLAKKEQEMAQMKERIKTLEEAFQKKVNEIKNLKEKSVEINSDLETTKYSLKSMFNSLKILKIDLN
jgi:hypothetical protein